MKKIGALTLLLVATMFVTANADLKRMILIPGHEGATAKATDLKDSHAKDVGASFENATFDEYGELLIVGVPADALPGVVKVDFKSDCPNNSQYGVEGVDLALGKRQLLKRSLEAWSRARHKTRAKLRGIFRTCQNGVRNYDVQFDIETVGLVR